MSSDNGIYIGSFPTINGGVEYRVIHAQAIENCDDNPLWSQEVSDATRVLYYGESAVYTDKNSALKRANEIHDEIMADDFCHIIE